MVESTKTNDNNISETPKLSSRERWQNFAGIFRYVFQYKLPFIGGVIFLLLSTGISLLFPYVASMLADSAVGESPTDAIGTNLSVNEIGLGLVAILVLQGIFSYMRIILFAKVSERTMGDIRKDLYGKLITLDLYFFEKRRVGELTSRITADVTQLQGVISVTLAEFFRQVATLAVGIVIIFYTSPRLTLIMLSTFPIGVIAAIFFGRYIRKLSRKTQDALATANVVVEETLQSIQVVKAFTNEWFEQKRYTSSINEVVDYALRAAHYRGLFVSFIISAVFGGIVLVLWQGALLVESELMTIGELIRFMLYTFFIGASIGGIGNMYGTIQQALGASERVNDILAEDSELELNENIEHQDVNGNIEYRHVKFAYPTRQDIRVLKNLNLKIEKGQKVALVGASGAGKSTIIQLLLRLYEVSDGDIFVNNKKITEYNISSLRRNIGIVPQEVILFGGTIEENISYGKPAATKEEIREAAQKANALDFIEGFPEGFETVVGERGVKLSGGQRQRIAIARAILKDPCILILDEATSSLDTHSEKLVQDALDKLMQNRTTIIIAHRLATIRQVNCIYVIEQGEIIEKGTHFELSNKTDGKYQQLLKMQFQEV
ncbi:MAG: ABC transporter ATP-binding protein [Chitinophagales bacterium]